MTINIYQNKELVGTLETATTDLTDLIDLVDAKFGSDNWNSFEVLKT